MGVAVLGFSLKVIYDWDKLIAFSPDVIGGLFLEIAPIIIIQLLTLISKRKDFSLKISKNLLNFSKTKTIESNLNTNEIAVIFVNNNKSRFLAIIFVAITIAILYDFKEFLLLSPKFFIRLLISFLRTLFIWEGAHRLIQTLVLRLPNNCIKKHL